MKRKTVIIVGAGASAEFGLPLGATLQDQIATMADIRFRNGVELISGDYQIYQSCRAAAKEAGLPDVNVYLKSGWLIRDGIKLTDSIDNFMDKHAADEKLQLIGKLGIAKAICTAENKSSLYVNRSNDEDKLPLAQLENTWLVRLFKHLQREVGFEQRDRIFDNVSFVVFNYDRCIEYFFVWALRLSYGISEREASEIVASADIYHPYGFLGQLPHFPDTGSGFLEFGATQYSLPDVADRIYTYSENVKDTERLEEARGWIAAAKQLVFLGSAFHPQNLDILTPDTDINISHVVGTAYNISEYDRDEIVSDLNVRFNPKRGHWALNLVASECDVVLQNFSRAFF